MIVLDASTPAPARQIIEDAAAKGVKVIDYDRLITGVSGTRTDYYVSFDNVKVGTLIGQGMVSCASAWKVSKPNMIVMAGSATDNNATLFSQGYNAVLAPHFASGWTKAATPAGTWDPPTALKDFTGAYTAHPGVNSVLVPNDENAAPIIHVPPDRTGSSPTRSRSLVRTRRRLASRTSSPDTSAERSTSRSSLRPRLRRARAVPACWRRPRQPRWPTPPPRTPRAARASRPST